MIIFMVTQSTVPTALGIGLKKFLNACVRACVHALSAVRIFACVEFCVNGEMVFLAYRTASLYLFKNR